MKDFKFKGSKYESWCHTGHCESTVINNERELTKNQHLQTLILLREYIKNNNLKAEDSDTTGDKYTQCNWGMCSNEVEIYPTSDLHTFPLDFEDHGRMSSLNATMNHECPMRKMNYSLNGDIDQTDMSNLSGCFYQCAVFQRRFKTPTRDRAMQLYNDAIEDIKNEI